MWHVEALAGPELLTDAPQRFSDEPVLGVVDQLAACGNAPSVHPKGHCGCAVTQKKGTRMPKIDFLLPWQRREASCLECEAYGSVSNGDQKELAF